MWDVDKQDRLNAGGSSMELREYQFDAIVDIVKSQSVLFGNGYGYIGTEEWAETSSYFRLFGIESIIFQIILESGILGLLAFLFLFCKIGLILCKSASKSSGTSTWILCLTFVGVYLLSCVITGNRSSMQIFYTFCFLLIRMFSQTCRDNDKETNRFVHQM